VVWPVWVTSAPDQHPSVRSRSGLPKYQTLSDHDCCRRIPPNPSEAQTSVQAISASATTPKSGATGATAVYIDDEEEEGEPNSDDEEEEGEPDSNEAEDAMGPYSHREGQATNYNAREQLQQPKPSRHDSPYSASQSYQNEHLPQQQSMSTITNMMANMRPWEPPAQPSYTDYPQSSIAAGPRHPTEPAQPPYTGATAAAATASTIASLPADAQANIKFNERRYITASPDNSAFEKLDNRRNMTLVQ
jgi:hypothetical protein